MSYQLIDMTKDPRSGQFAYFRQMLFPFAGVTAEVDITVCLLYTSGHGEVVAEHIRQRGPDVYHPLHLLAVEEEGHQLILILCHYSSPPASFTAVSYTHLDVYKRQV